MKLLARCVPPMLLVFILTHSSSAQSMGEYYKKGIDCAAQQDFKSAIENFTKAIELSPTEARPYNYRGICKFNLKDYAAALEDFNKAIELNPKFADAYYMRGMCKVGLKKKKDACPDFQTAVDLGHPTARDALNKYCD